jgi:hypothetical protein
MHQDNLAYGSPNDLYCCDHYVEERQVHVWRYNSGTPILFATLDDDLFNWQIWSEGTIRVHGAVKG